MKSPELKRVIRIKEALLFQMHEETAKADGAPPL